MFDTECGPLTKRIYIQLENIGFLVFVLSIHTLHKFCRAIRTSSQTLKLVLHKLRISMTSSSLPTTMKTLLQPDLALKSLTLTNRPLPVPLPNSNEHLIRVHAVALTNGELLWMKNFPPPADLSKGKEPVPCYDMSGTVITAPPDSPFQSGSEVYGRTNYLRTAAGREYTICETSELALKPATLSFSQAATVPVSVETAYQALFTHSPLLPVAGTGAQGKRVFVTAASRAVGMVCRFSDSLLFPNVFLDLKFSIVQIRQC